MRDIAGPLFSPVHPNSHFHSAALSDDDATELLLSLVGWYLDAIAQGTSPLVSKKLSSALATFFLRYHQLWPRYICHLIFCFASHQIYRPDLVDPSLDIATFAQKLEPQKIQAILWVATTVAEDATKVDLNTATKYVALPQSNHLSTKQSTAWAFMKHCSATFQTPWL